MHETSTHTAARLPNCLTKANALKSAKLSSGQCGKLVTARARIWCTLLTTEKQRQHILLLSASCCGAEEVDQGGMEMILLCTISLGNQLLMSSSKVNSEKQQTLDKHRMVKNNNGAQKLSQLCVEDLLTTPQVHHLLTKAGRT